MFTYSIQIEPQPEGGFTVTVPALPGCVSEGETLDEAVANIKDAVQLYLLSLRDLGRPLPIEAKLGKVSIPAKSLAHA